MPSARTPFNQQHPLLTAPPSRSPLALVGTHFLHPATTRSVASKTADRLSSGRDQQATTPRPASRRHRCRNPQSPFPSVFCVASRSVYLVIPNDALFCFFDCIRRVSSTHHTSYKSPVTRLHLSIPAFDTPNDWGWRGGVAAAAALAAGAGACWCWGNFNPRHNLATRVHTTHLFWSLPPSLQRSCWPHPPPKQNPPSPGHPGSSQHCPLQISHSRLGSPALPVQPSLIWALLAILDSFPDTCTRRDTEIIAKLRQQALQSFSTVFCCPSSRVSNSTLSLPIPSNSPILSSFHPPPHRTARHTLAACLPPATQPRQTLRLTHTVTQDSVCQT